MTPQTKKPAFVPFSAKQMQVLCWWLPESPFHTRDAVICDGAVRSGKTLCMSVSFVAWAFSRFDGCAFALCGKTIASLRRNLVMPLLPLLIPVMLTEYLLALGLCFIVAGVTVYFRDLEHITGIFVMLWQFLTPIMYPVDAVPEKLRDVFMLNPMTPIISCYRDILYYRQVPQLSNLALSIGFGVFFLIIGWLLFGHLQKHFAEEL